LTTVWGKAEERPVWRWAAIGLGILGLLDSLYLSWVRLAGATAACSGIGDCDAVNNSRYAEIYGVPVALLGAGLYGIMLVLLIAEGRLPERREAIHFVLFGMSLGGVLFSAYLTYLEIAVLRAICPYCVVSAIILVALLGISVIRLREPREADETGRE
jgi:uncharacterized membrane protein